MLSNRVECQVEVAGRSGTPGSTNGDELLSMALSMTISFRMDAVIAIFGNLPARRSRSWNSRKTGFSRMATSVLIYRMALTSARPPQIMRLPLDRLLSRLNGATPTRAAIFFRSRLPSSGKRPSSVAAATGPMPGAVRSGAAFLAKSGNSSNQ